MILPILVLFLISPYVISNHMAFFFLIPSLYLIYSAENFNYKLFLQAIIISAMIALLPVVLYNPFIYLIGSAIVATFLFAFFVISRVIVKKIGGALSVFAPCMVWVSLLYIFNFKSVLASMFDIGVLAPMSAPMIWYTGSIGLTVLIVLFNSAAARFFTKRDRFSLILTILIAASFIGSFVFSVTKDPGYLSAVKKPVKIALIQGAIPSRTLFGYKENIDSRIKRYVDLSSKADSTADIIIWPEYAFPADVIARFPDKAKPVFDRIKQSGKTFVIGSIRNDPARKGIYYDSALVIGSDGNIKQTYHSSKPFVFSKNITPGQFDGALYIDNAGIVLCWEEFGAKIFRDYVNSGAEYFIALLSDVDLDHSWLKKYVTFFSRARAAESMRYLARVTQTGVTELISPFGKVLASIPVDKAGYLAGDVYKVSEKTFYCVHGDILTRIFMVAMIFLLIYAARRKRAGEHE